MTTQIAFYQATTLCLSGVVVLLLAGSAFGFLRERRLTAIIADLHERLHSKGLFDFGRGGV